MADRHDAGTFSNLIEPIEVGKTIAGMLEFLAKLEKETALASWLPPKPPALEPYESRFFGAGYSYTAEELRQARYVWQPVSDDRQRIHIGADPDDGDRAAVAVISLPEEPMSTKNPEPAVGQTWDTAPIGGSGRRTITRICQRACDRFPTVNEPHIHTDASTWVLLNKLKQHCIFVPTHYEPRVGQKFRSQYQDMVVASIDGAWCTKQPHGEGAGEPHVHWAHGGWDKISELTSFYVNPVADDSPRPAAITIPVCKGCGAQTTRLLAPPYCTAKCQRYHNLSIVIGRVEMAPDPNLSPWCAGKAATLADIPIQRREPNQSPFSPHTFGDIEGHNSRVNRPDSEAGCRLGCACAIHRPPRPAPYVPAVDEWDLLPDAPGVFRP